MAINMPGIEFRYDSLTTTNYSLYTMLLMQNIMKSALDTKTQRHLEVRCNKLLM